MNIFKQLYSNNYFYYFHFGLLFISALFTAFGAILVSQDTHSYINADIYRSLGYPVFIEIHELLFGSYFMFAIKISQFLIFYSCLHYFFKTVKNILKLNDLSSILFFGVLVIPVFYEQKLLNSILTESLSYSLYLLFIGFYCSGIQYNDNKKTGWVEVYIGADDIRTMAEAKVKKDYAVNGCKSTKIDVSFSA
jgi:hypothetical protein